MYTSRSSSIREIRETNLLIIITITQLYFEYVALIKMNTFAIQICKIYFIHYVKLFKSIKAIQFISL